MTVDNIMLEDLVKYQKIEYKVIKGYAWTGKKDFTIRDVIKQIYNARVIKKREGNPIQETLKLIMNSSYGKTIQRPIKKQFNYVRNDEADTYAMTHYHQLYQATEIIDGDKTLFEMYKPLDKQFNNCLYGIQVLSMSKRIMNEVICLAEDLDLRIYYQDTDSIHIVNDDIPILEKAYNAKYNRELIGGDMGQFHSDFDIFGDSGSGNPQDPMQGRSKNNPVSIESYFVGKKMYVDKLKNDVGQIHHHIRLKGVPNETIEIMVNEKYGGDPMKLYDHLYNDGEETFDICKGRPQFSFNKNGTIKTMTEFNRKIKKTAH